MRKINRKCYGPRQDKKYARTKATGLEKNLPNIQL